MTVAGGGSLVTFPVAVVEVNGVRCRALLDTGVSSSYASAALLDRVNSRPLRKKVRQIEMMMTTTRTNVEVHKINVTHLSGGFRLEVTKVNRSVLLALDNPRYPTLITQYAHLQGVTIDDTDTKPQFPVHLILGISEYTKIKTKTAPKVGNPGEPVAELTKLGWTIMSPGNEANLSQMLLTQTSPTNYENLCKLDVLGLQGHPTGDQNSVYKEFKEQLVRSSDGWYETGLMLKGHHPPLANNKQGSLKRLDNLVKKLGKQPDLLANYDAIIKDQLSRGIVERVNKEPKGKEFYIPHKPVLRETAESTKTRIVNDASARPNDKSPSLNECLEPGPPLQNQLFSVLVKNRFHPVALAGELRVYRTLDYIPGS